MASMNFCPCPVEPWKLIMMTTYPLGVDEVGDANSSGFQRKLQSSPQARCGPPWMRNFTGYFFEASKFGGLTRKPSTLSPCAPSNQNVCSGLIRTWERTESLKWVKGCSCNDEHSLVRSTTVWSHRVATPRVSAKCSSFGATIDMLGNMKFPSSVRGRQSL